MGNIEALKRYLTKHFAKTYYSSTYEELSEAEQEKCSKLAEAHAFLNDVIPEEYLPYSIFNFTGKVMKGGGVVTTVPPEIVEKVKDQICEFCWGSSWEDLVKVYSEGSNAETSLAAARKFMRERNIMHLRMDKGANVVVHGDHLKNLGRTMIASLIMKQAIWPRLYRDESHTTYAFLPMNELKDFIVRDTEEALYCRTCTWLAVDDVEINVGSLRARHFAFDMFDPFFLGRYRDKLPTILILRRHLSECENSLQSTYGAGISKIIKSPRTIKIALSKSEVIE